MKKKKADRKVPNCLNCGQQLPASDNYCSNCGQENVDNNIKLQTLLGEFFSNYFSFDSRFARSIKPFLIQPGRLTNEFLEGKRVNFANPVRLYLIISLFHFYLFSMITDMSDYDGNFNVYGNNKYDPDKYTTEQLDSIALTLSDTVYGEAELEPLSEKEMFISKSMKDKDYSLNEIYDSLQINEKPFWERLFAKQSIKVEREGGEAIGNYFIQNIPVMIFLVLPIYALLLKLFFFRKGYYIKHLIHTLHIHSFFFFILGISWGLALLDWISWEDGIMTSFGLIILYLLFSFRKVYQQGYIKLVLKIIGLGFLYSIVLLIATVAVSIVSFALF